MYIQWCAKGIIGQSPNDADGITDQEARAIVDDGHGIVCNWWRDVSSITQPQRRDKLNDVNLHRHVHDYSNFKRETPFISLAAGAVERDTFLQTNRIFPAERTARAFATLNGTRPGYVFHLWVIVGIKPAVEVEQVAEEIRNLHTYRRWSPFQLEGEVTAKIGIPAVQIHRVDKWEATQSGGIRHAGPGWPHFNSHFEEPAVVSNIRDLF